MKYLLLFLVCVSCYSCNNNKKEITKIITTWQNKEFLLPDSLETRVSGQQIEYPNLHHKYKILNYIDTNGCTPCQLKLHEWELLKKEIDSINPDVKLIFIAYVKNYNEIELEQKINKSTIPIIYDKEDMINKMNNIPKYAILHTFLLDSTNHVILIGNPLERPKIWELYKNKITQSTHTIVR